MNTRIYEGSKVIHSVVHTGRGKPGNEATSITQCSTMSLCVPFPCTLAGLGGFLTTLAVMPHDTYWDSLRGSTTGSRMGSQESVRML